MTWRTSELKPWVPDAAMPQWMKSFQADFTGFNELRGRQAPTDPWRVWPTFELPTGSQLTRLAVVGEPPEGVDLKLVCHAASANHLLEFDAWALSRFGPEGVRVNTAGWTRQFEVLAHARGSQMVATCEFVVIFQGIGPSPIFKP